MNTLVRRPRTDRISHVFTIARKRLDFAPLDDHRPKNPLLRKREFKATSERRDQPPRSAGRRPSLSWSPLAS
jgi:hypothetical protein